LRRFGATFAFGVATTADSRAHQSLPTVHHGAFGADGRTISVLDLSAAGSIVNLISDLLDWR
jgi:hypothetical protein